MCIHDTMKTGKVQGGSVNIAHADCLDFIRRMEAGSVALAFLDPPYNINKATWDKWPTDDAFLAWLDTVLEGIARVLASNGSLYVCAYPTKAARVEVLVGERFNVLNSVVWIKDAGWHKKVQQEMLRAYFPQTERIIFAEHYGADSSAKSESGYQRECDKLRGFVFEPLRTYIVDEFKRAGMLSTTGKIAANVACGFSPTSGGMASRHYFSVSQWLLPTKEHYTKLRELLNQHGGDYLRREYDDLRRPFQVTAQDQYTDVWTFPTVQTYKGKHPCEKPAALLEHVIKTSSRPGDLILDPFLGSGSTGVAAVKLGRRFVGCDIDRHWVDVAAERIASAGVSAIIEADGDTEEVKPVQPLLF